MAEEAALVVAEEAGWAVAAGWAVTEEAALVVAGLEAAGLAAVDSEAALAEEGWAAAGSAVVDSAGVGLAEVGSAAAEVKEAAVALAAAGDRRTHSALALPSARNCTLGMLRTPAQMRKERDRHACELAAAPGGRPRCGNAWRMCT
jgi:hypothetical protein